jgi:hypothetical protein
MEYSSKKFTQGELSRFERSLGRFLGRHSFAKREYILQEYGLDIEAQPKDLIELNFAWACLLEMKAEIPPSVPRKSTHCSGAASTWVCRDTGIEFTSQWVCDRWREAFAANGVEFTESVRSRIRNLIFVDNQLGRCTIPNLDDKIASYLNKLVKRKTHDKSEENY